MPPGGTIILILKVLVAAVTVLLALGLAALARGNVRLHGRINLVFFILTMTTVVAFEGLLQLGPTFEDGWSVTRGWTDGEKLALKAHLVFVVPLLVVLPAMLYTGWRRLRRIHVPLAVVFSVLWAGMLATGLFMLPHDDRTSGRDSAAARQENAP